VSRGQGDESLRPYSRLSRPDIYTEPNNITSQILLIIIIIKPLVRPWPLFQLLDPIHSR
jgi:hypothetical protein